MVRKSWSDITVSSCGISRLTETHPLPPPVINPLIYRLPFTREYEIWTRSRDAAERKREESPAATDWIRGISRPARAFIYKQRLLDLCTYRACDAF